MRNGVAWLLLLAACGGGGSGDESAVRRLPAAESAHVHWETPVVHPLDLTPDGTRLLACHLADHRLEVFAVTAAGLEPVASIFVGLDPVAVRARTDSEAWVVSHLSDSVSIVDLDRMVVVRTLRTRDEPCDVVFANGRAFVSCSQADVIQVFDLDDLDAAPAEVPVEAEDPRALAVSLDGTTVHAAVFESGNGTTLLAGGADGNTVGFPPSVVNDPEGPHGGVNPPPFDLPQRPGNPAPPATGLIVRLDAAGAWRDDTGADWTRFVSGDLAERSGRPAGWTLFDRDVAHVDTDTLAVTYSGGALNTVMALAVHPGTGRVTTVGTDATNEVRHEPNLNGRFLRVLAAEGGTTHDLNPHLDYSAPRTDAATRTRSIGDPRAIVWNAAGDRAYVAGMGSSNVVVVDDSFARVGAIAVGEGPAGLALRGTTLYVLNRFESSISVVDTATLAETARSTLFDPTPAAVRRGRPHLYDTHATSGLGHLSCGSCHVDARIDRLAWDLGDPGGAVEPMDQNCITDALVECEDFHPMKGPMLTQTLQDIVGKEPFHWRGDRDGLEEFNPAFPNLLGAERPLTATEMQEFEDFLATIHFPPNPFRTLENGLPDSLPLPGHFTPGRFGPAGQPLPVGNAVAGLAHYRTASLDGGVPGFQCVTCHTLPTGMGSELMGLAGGPGGTLPVGPNGERHHALVSVDGSTNVSMKIPQLRNLYDRVGFEMSQTTSRAGFGFLHDGSVDSIARFVSEPVFNVTSVQQVADLVAFMLAFSGSDLPTGSTTQFNEPLGPGSRDTHAAVGVQLTFDADGGDQALLNRLVALADAGAIDLVSHRGARGAWYDADAKRWVPDTEGWPDEVVEPAEFVETTYTAVPKGMGRRLGIDPDEDGYADGAERLAGSDPADPSSRP